MLTNASAGPVEVLLVEDDPGEIVLVQEAFEESHQRIRLRVVEDGVEALAFLRRGGKYAQAARPDLILLDLKMPKKGGLELLAEIKADEDLRQIPVIVLTSSSNADDISKAYDLQASFYVTKPADVEEFQRVMNSISDFCLTVVKLPPPK